MDLTGTRVDYHQPGGFHVTVDEAELRAHLGVLEELRDEAGDEGYEYELVQGQTLAGCVEETLGKRSMCKKPCNRCCRK